MIYLKFQAPERSKNKSSQSKLKEGLMNSIVSVLEKILPKANPDFENKINDVKFWIVEFDDQTNLPNSEIGLDKNGKVIMTMPDERNYGYWTDNNLKKEDFEKHFQTEEIEAVVFKNYWNLLKNKNS